MTEKEEAENLINDFYEIIGKNYSKGDGFAKQLYDEAKQCALVHIKFLEYHLESAIGTAGVEYCERLKKEIKNK